MYRASSRLLLTAGLGLALLAGCGGSDGPELVPVAGQVKFNGAPLPEGSIVFRPAEGPGQSYAGRIENGQFAFESTTGPKRVEITAYREVPAPAQYQDSGEGASRVQYIPKTYNENSTLQETVSESEDQNQFTFELKGASGS
jgi:hypothetical protein